MRAIKELIDLLASEHNVTADSRQVRPGTVFVAVRGETADGHHFIRQALEQGAVAVVAEKKYTDGNLLNDTRIKLVPDSREVWARLSQNHFGNPASGLIAIGITGTNGKTSVSWIVSEALALHGLGTAHLGTLGKRYRFADKPSPLEPLENTTPDAMVTAQYLRQCLDLGARAVVMEVSSHALVQQRTRGIEWNGAVYTNLTRDHLDFHASMESYRDAKARLFECELAESKKVDKFFVVNVDDDTGLLFAQRCADLLPQINLITVSAEPDSAIHHRARVRVSNVNYHNTGTEMTVAVDNTQWQLQSRLLGEYNVANMATAVGTLLGLGIEPPVAVTLLAGVPPVPGRLELVSSHQIRVFVDYAHTPDALVRAQRSLRAITPGKLITVFGCGGNRDRGKRPLMARAVEEHADIAVVTSDNPRDESPEAIIADATRGFTGSRSDFKPLVEVDRRRAIGHAIELAKPGDSILIAGKGHEPYQEINGVRHPFSDQEIARAILADHS